MLIISIGLDITFSFNKDFGGQNGQKWTERIERTEMDQTDRRGPKNQSGPK